MECEFHNQPFFFPDPQAGYRFFRAARSRLDLEMENRK
jgi:hypothetical protein